MILKTLGILVNIIGFILLAAAVALFVAAFGGVALIGLAIAAWLSS